MKDFIYKYNVGQNIKDEYKDLIIIDRKFEPFINSTDGYEKTKKIYKIHCNKCGFDSGEHYFKGQLVKEYWISEPTLNKRKYCPCCHNVVICKNINSIYKTDNWMIDYFVDKENGYKYSKSSNVMIDMKCKYCNTILGKHTINRLYSTKKMSCICNDTISFPNKVSYYLFQEIKEQLKYYEREYCPEWIYPYRYDNFIILSNEKQYIIEMDGAIGHGNIDFTTGKKDYIGIERDNFKDDMALKNNIEVIRIDCFDTDFNSIKFNIQQKLSKIINLDKVDWDKIYKLSIKNIVYEVCKIYNSVKSTNPQYYPFQLSGVSIRNYLRIGNSLSMCNYKTMNQNKLEKAKIISEARINNPNISVAELNSLLGFKSTRNRSVYDYMSIANDLGLYNFDIDKEKKMSRSKSLDKYRHKRFKKLYAYDGIHNLSLEFENAPKAVEYFKEKYNLKLWTQNIGKVCNGKLKHTQHIIFSYEPIVIKEDT